MSELSNYLEEYVLNFSLKDSAKPPYLALYVTDPTDADVGTECSWPDYERQLLVFGAIQNGVATITNNASYATVTGDTVIVTHIGIHDAAEGGNLLYHTPLGSWDTDVYGVVVFNNGTRHLYDNDDVNIPIGGISVTIT